MEAVKLLEQWCDSIIAVLSLLDGMEGQGDSGQGRGVLGLLKWSR